MSVRCTLLVNISKEKEKKTKQNRHEHSNNMVVAIHRVCIHNKKRVKSKETGERKSENRHGMCLCVCVFFYQSCNRNVICYVFRYNNHLDALIEIVGETGKMQRN